MWETEKKEKKWKRISAFFLCVHMFALSFFLTCSFSASCSLLPIWLEESGIFVERDRFVAFSLGEEEEEEEEEKQNTNP